MRATLRRVFDAHCHIIDRRFPHLANKGYVPPAFNCADYKATACVPPLNVVSGAIVSGSFQAYDQTYLEAALKTLGPEFVGVAQVPLSVSDDEAKRLAKLRVRAMRINLFRGDSGSSLVEAIALAKRMHALVGWHTEVYTSTASLSAAEVSLLGSLPQLAVDHLGMNGSDKGIAALLDLVDAGACVKATGFGRVGEEGEGMDVARVLQLVAERNANALIFGTDLPSTRARRPFALADVDLVVDALGPELAQRALWDNARSLYRLDNNASST